MNKIKNFLVHAALSPMYVLIAIWFIGDTIYQNIAWARLQRSRREFGFAVRKLEEGDGAK